jgi:hypothetical protein
VELASIVTTSALEDVWQAVVKVCTACREDETTERARSLESFFSGILHIPFLEPLFRPY